METCLSWCGCQMRSMPALAYATSLHGAGMSVGQSSQCFLCMHAGIAFAGVHDSFWTHAADVPILARLLREAFVDLHSQPLLQNLHDELTARQPGSTGTQARHNVGSGSQPNSEDLQKKRLGKKKLDPQIPDPPELGNLDLNQVHEAEYFFN